MLVDFACDPSQTPITRGSEFFNYLISRYHSSRNYGLYDGQKLVAVTVYQKGAEAVKARLEADADTIAELQRQIDELKALAPHFREQATDTPPQQLPLIAAEDNTTYERPPRKPSPRQP